MRKRLPVLLICACFSITACSGEPHEFARLSVALPSLHDPGQTLRTDDLPGPAVINLWASWCLPCRREVPQLHQIAMEHQVYGLSFRDPVEDAERWLDYYGNPFLSVGVDPEGRHLNVLAERGVPQTFVVDGNGRIRFHHIGPLTDTVLADALLPAIRRAHRSPP